MAAIAKTTMSRLFLLLILPFLLSMATAVEEPDSKNSLRKLRTNTAGLDLKQGREELLIASSESAQRKLQSEFIACKHQCNTVFGFNLANNALPVASTAEILEVLRQTEVRTWVNVFRSGCRVTCLCSFFSFLQFKRWKSSSLWL